jgi:hypothetical protein
MKFEYFIWMYKFANNFFSSLVRKLVLLKELISTTSLFFFISLYCFNSVLNSVKNFVKKFICVFKTCSFSGIVIFANPFSKNSFFISNIILFFSSLYSIEYLSNSIHNLFH